MTFYGVRFWLKGPDGLHQTEHDDDRPAVTFWSRSVAELAGLMRRAQWGRS